LIHCVSFGELEQAKPLIPVIKEKCPDSMIILSFFSPSGYQYYKPIPEINLVIYIPIDSFFSTKKFFQLIQPHIMIVVKHDVWPNHLFQSKRERSINILIDANLPKSSRKLTPLIRNFFRRVYNQFDLILAVSNDDADRFRKLRLTIPHIHAVGDTRYDQVYARSIKFRNSRLEELRTFSQGQVFAAGSIWPSDVEHIIPALKDLYKHHPELKVILVPHEPTPKFLDDLDYQLDTIGISHLRYSQIKTDCREKILVIDKIGILAHVYKYASIVYIGGSFGPGVHNVMEPAIFNKPVLFGPRHDNSYEALVLVKTGGGMIVRDSQTISSIVSDILQDQDKCKKMGEIAEKMVLNNLGATQKIASYLDEYLQ